MKFLALFPAKFSDLIDRTLKITQNTRRRGRSLRQCAQFRGFCSAACKTCACCGQMCGPGGRFFRPAARRAGFLQEAEEKAAEKGSPPRGAGAKVTERLLHICGDLSVSASPSHLPWEGRPWGTHSNGFPYEGKAFGTYRSELISASGSALPCRPCRAGGIWGW